MFEYLPSVVATLLAVYLLLLAAFPESFWPIRENKIKRLGARQWGIYEGASVEETETEQQIVVRKPARKAKAVAGSVLYAYGRSISFRR